jgi:hypothetical protein
MNEETTPRLEIDLQGLPPILRTVTFDQCYYASILIELRNLNAQIAELIALQTKAKPTKPKAKT